MLFSFFLLFILTVSTTNLFHLADGVAFQINPDDTSLPSRCPMCQGFTVAASFSEAAKIRTSPHRPFHANGGGAHGHFVVTHDITKLTKLSLFSQIGKKTEVLARFSTNWGGSGSPDVPVLPPDSRGFAVKFYTDDGNMDLVGGNRPVSPLRDIRNFGRMEAARGLNLHSHVPDANAWWNFTVTHPESLMQTIQLFSDFAYPTSWRYMDGIFPHAVKLVNVKSEAVYAKFQFLADQKAERKFSYAEISDQNRIHLAYSKEDLYKAIEAGQFPSWTLHVQIMTFEQAHQSKMNPFDSTKVWPESLYPLTPVGKMVLDQNPINYHTEIEIAAFNPGCLLPGVEMSGDPILNARALSYGLAQTSRLGANFMSLPPNTLKGVKTDEERRWLQSRLYNTLPEVEWQKIWDEPDDFEQPRQFYEDLSKNEKERLAHNIARWLSRASSEVEQLTVDLFAKVNQTLATNIKKACARLHYAQ